MNEMKALCDKLEGYSDPKWYVVQAQQLEPGRWSIEVVLDDSPKESQPMKEETDDNL